MKNIKTLCLILFSFLVNGAQAQRTLDILSPPDSINSYAVTFEDKAYIAQQGRGYFSSYDGERFTRYNFPIVEGRSLVYSGWENNMTVLDSCLYLRLHSIDGFIYKFNGSTFSQVPLPGDPETRPIAYQGRIYTLVQVGSAVKLYSYNGTSSIEIPISELLPAYGYAYSLTVADQYLFISAYSGSGSSSDTNILIRYDGSNTLNIPIPYEYNGRIEDILAVEGTEEIYFKIWDSTILHFDGSTLREVYSGGLDYISSFILWNDNLYFQSTVSDNAVYRYDRTGLTALVLPDGAIPIFASNCVVFEDQLFIPATLSDGRNFIYVYDGSNYVMRLALPEVTFYPDAFIREDKYVIIPWPGSGSTILEYDGVSFTEIVAPDDRGIVEYLTSTSCFHLWNVDFNSPDNVYEIAKEDKRCYPRITVIPEILWRFEWIDIWAYGYFRDWCWTDLLLDWKITPICPLCPAPGFEAAFTDGQGKEVWSEQFDNPIKLPVPFNDKQPYSLTLSSIIDESTEDLFIFDEDLVAKGISAINISMMPKKDYFLLTAETEKGEQVPFITSLLNKKGEVIWRKEFSAPMSEEITAYVEEPGAALQFSSVSSNTKKLEDYGVASVKIYPNPFKGKLSVDVSTDGNQIPAKITITDLQGQIVLQTKMVAPGLKTIEMSDHKAGIYILRFKVEDAIMTEQIILDY